MTYWSQTGCLAERVSRRDTLNRYKKKLRNLLQHQARKLSRPILTHSRLTWGYGPTVQKEHQKCSMLCYEAISLSLRLTVDGSKRPLCWPILQASEGESPGDMLHPAFLLMTWLSPPGVKLSLALLLTWRRDVELGRQEQPDPYAWRGQRRVSPPTYSFTHGRQLWEGGDFHVHNKFTPGCQVFAFGSSYERPPVSLYQLSIRSSIAKQKVTALILLPSVKFNMHNTRK